ncbi:hypothetical protein [Brevibacillus porteri]|uniref:hypothetical protein n=1 Tax=Brevibacillus porteri TaxID=2126350 RepID=UPI003D1F8E1E
MTITLSTGKKVTQREKRGQHNFIERKLLATCMGEGGQNIGGALSAVSIRTIIGIEAVDGEAVTIPSDLAGVFEVMDKFGYEEWNELESKMLPKETQEQLAAAAKNLANSPGSETE